jgi:Ca2+-binding RTX toxin-like protein
MPKFEVGPGFYADFDTIPIATASGETVATDHLIRIKTVAGNGRPAGFENFIGDFNYDSGLPTGTIDEFRFVTDAEQLVYLIAQANIDVVELRETADLGDPQAFLKLIFRANDSLTGAALDDVMGGFDGRDRLMGKAGDDWLRGMNARDTVRGDAGNDVLYGGKGADRLLGGVDNDQLLGGAGEDLLNGEDGDDLRVGGLGRDVQIGGTGRDTFDFNKTVESRVGANHDVVKGFSHAQHDRINLQTIDADTTTGGNQAFDFIGGTGFTGTAGELRLSAGLLLGDTNGNGIADFEIKVTGIGAGANSDFVL